MKELTLLNYDWDDNGEIYFTPRYEDWFNEYGNTDLMEVEIISLKYGESMSVVLCLDDMIKLQEFLKNKINTAKSSGYYEE